MFAVFEDGSRQFRVQAGDVLAVDYRKDVQDGETITFDKVLLANGGGPSIVGQPVISGASVTAEVAGVAQLQRYAETGNSNVLHRRGNAFASRHTGHRQKYTRERSSWNHSSESEKRLIHWRRRRSCQHLRSSRQRRLIAISLP